MMWVTYAFGHVTVLCDRHGRIIAYGRGAAGDRVRGMAVRLNGRRTVA